MKDEPLRGEVTVELAAPREKVTIDDPVAGNPAAPDFHILADNIPYIVFCAGVSGSFDFANRWFASYAGLPAESLFGYGWQGIVHPDDLESYADASLRELEAGGIFEVECRLRRYDGEYRWHAIRGIPVRDGAGGVRKWVGTATDIHDTKATVVAGPPKWLQQIFDMMPAGVVLVEMGTGRITFSNPNADWMSGNLIDEEGRAVEANAHPVARVARGEQLHGLPIRFQEPEGTRVLVFHSGVLPPAPSQPSTAILVFQDATALRNAEAEIERKAAELSRAIEETQEFAYAASHDLQEPLRMVAGYTQLLSRRYAGKLDSDADEYLQYAAEGANRMQQLVRDLLALSRAGNPESRRLERVELASVVQWAMMNLHPAVTESAAVITHDRLPAVMADQARLAMVMQNLIANAIKFRSLEPPKIHISVASEAENWVFCVEDNGIGFDMKYAGRIFGVFKRLHGQDFPGTGIGLAIAKKVVEIHRGRMWAESEPGKGSRFYFTLPAQPQ